jgi:hypothetical protein
LFNATTDVIGYFALMASALPFWAMRFVAREKEGAINIDIPWKRARAVHTAHPWRNITIIPQILSLQKHWDKAVNNALVAKAIQVCASKGPNGSCMAEKETIRRWTISNKTMVAPSLN